MILNRTNPDRYPFSFSYDGVSCFQVGTFIHGFHNRIIWGRWCCSSNTTCGTTFELPTANFDNCVLTRLIIPPCTNWALVHLCNQLLGAWHLAHPCHMNLSIVTI